MIEHPTYSPGHHCEPFAGCEGPNEGAIECRFGSGSIGGGVVGLMIHCVCVKGVVIGCGGVMLVALLGGVHV